MISKFLGRACRVIAQGALPLALIILSGCVSSQAPSSGATVTSSAEPDHGYALLYNLLGDEKNVSKLLLIKRERAALRDLIKAISERTDRAHQQLEAFAKADRHLNLKDQGLPAAERETRASISKARAKQLITDKGKDFELRLLLTQDEALTYGVHLATVLAAREKNPARAKFLQQLAGDLAELDQRIMAMLFANYSPPAER